jgi:hypothetical protein
MGAGFDNHVLTYFTYSGGQEFHTIILVILLPSNIFIIECLVILWVALKNLYLCSR